VLSGETTNTNFVIFGLTQAVLGTHDLRTRGEHANRYASAEKFEDTVEFV